MENKLEKRYGLLTAISMVVGIVIGSGVFFKAQDVLRYTGGNMPMGILAWAIGGAVMICCAYTFSGLASKYEKINGVVDYAEAAVGRRYAYITGWFLSTMYYPGMTSVLAWVSARYTLELFGNRESSGGLCLALAGFYLCLSFVINSLSPVLAGKLQVSATVIKLIPLVIMAAAGIIVGSVNGNMVEAFSSWHRTGSSGGVFAAVVATAFAYEGWIIATTINSELKNSKKNLPIALVLGTTIIALVYILYYVGLAGAVPVDVLINDGSPAAFRAVFGNAAGAVLNTFVVVSCLGTLNGLMLGSTRGLYSVAARGDGPSSRVLAHVDEATKMPSNSAAIALVLCAGWLFYYYGANLGDTPVFGIFSFDSSELPIITIYAFYIPIFVRFALHHGRENIFRGIVMPMVSTAASAFMLFAAVYAHGYVPYTEARAQGRFSCPVLFYALVFALNIGLGLFLGRGGKSFAAKSKRKNREEQA